MIGINYDLPDIRGNGFEMVGQRHRASAFTSNGAWGSDADFSQVYFSSRWNFIRGKALEISLCAEKWVIQMPGSRMWSA